MVFDPLGQVAVLVCSGGVVLVVWERQRQRRGGSVGGRSGTRRAQCSLVIACSTQGGRQARGALEGGAGGAPLTDKHIAT